MDLTVDRRAFSVVRRSDQAPDRHFWSAQPTAARIRAIELQRRIVYGTDRTAARLQRVFEVAERPSQDLFLRPDQVIRLGVPPVRIEVLTSIAGVEFDDCASRAVETTFGEVLVRFIGLDDLKTNKRAAGRHQDLADLDHLP